MKLETLLAEPRGWCWGCGRVTTDRALVLDPDAPANVLVFVCGECKPQFTAPARSAGTAGNVDA